MTGILSVNDLEDFLQLIYQIKSSVAGISHATSKPSVIALVGPSGSEKIEWMNRLLKESNIAHPTSYTTNPSNTIIYRYVSPEEFDKINFFEKTMYGGYGYGTKEEDIAELMNCGVSVVLPLDICGAIALKRKLPTLMVYCKQDKGTLIEKILERNCSINEKKLRLLALDQERKNEACNHSYTCWITSLWRSCFISWFFVINYRFFVIIRFQLWLYKYQSFYCCIHFFNHCINFFLSHI